MLDAATKAIAAQKFFQAASLTICLLSVRFDTALRSRQLYFFLFGAFYLIVMFIAYFRDDLFPGSRPQR
jgi:hypothetical protein